MDHSSTQIVARLGVDLLSAAVTALLVSPVVTVIDSTIMMKAAGGESFSTCLGRYLRPISSIPSKLFFSRPPRLVMAVYFGTYLTANCLDTITSILNNQPAATISASTAKFAATAVVSSGLTIYKDGRLAQIFGTHRHSTKVPLVSYCLFGLRDAITIFAIFNLPTLLAPQLIGIIDTEARRLKTAQFLLPAAIQFITTPIHLLGLDLHNRKGLVPMRARASLVAKNMRTAVPARIVRILPAFSVGGVANLSMRTTMMNSITTK